MSQSHWLASSCWHRGVLEKNLFEAFAAWGNCGSCAWSLNPDWVWDPTLYTMLQRKMIPWSHEKVASAKTGESVVLVGMQKKKRYETSRVVALIDPTGKINLPRSWFYWQNKCFCKGEIQVRFGGKLEQRVWLSEWLMSWPHVTASWRNQVKWSYPERWRFLHSRYRQGAENPARLVF